jgi:hypothetical protein
VEFLAELLIALVQLLCEFFLQVFAEALAEMGLEAIRETLMPSSPPRPVVAAVGYILLASLFALLSLWPFPHSFVRHDWLRIANLLVAPPMTGLVAVMLGQWRRKRGQQQLYFHRFGYGYLFALTFALVRLAFTQ